jgi:hypothetical protein
MCYGEVGMCERNSPIIINELYSWLHADNLHSPIIDNN